MCNGSSRPLSRSGETIDSNTGWQPLPAQRVSIDHVTRRCDTVSPAQPGSPTTVESWSKASKLNPNMPRCSPTFKSDGTVRRNSRHFGVTWASASKRSSPKIPYHQIRVVPPPSQILERPTTAPEQTPLLTRQYSIGADMTLQRKVPEVNEFRRTPSFGDPRRNDPNATIDLADCAISLHRTGSQIEKEWITTATPQRTVSRAGRSYIVLPERIQRDQGFKRYCHASSFYNQLQSMYYESWCTKPNLGSRHFPLTGLERTLSGLGRPNTVVTGMERTLSGLGRSDSQCFQDKLSGW